MRAPRQVIGYIHSQVSSSGDHIQDLAMQVTQMAEAIRTTVVSITQFIRRQSCRSAVLLATVVWIAIATGIGYRHDGSMAISSFIGKTVVRIAIATGIGYQHDRSMRFF